MYVMGSLLQKGQGVFKTTMGFTHEYFNPVGPKDGIEELWSTGKKKKSCLSTCDVFMMCFQSCFRAETHPKYLREWDFPGLLHIVPNSTHVAIFPRDHSR